MLLDIYTSEYVHTPRIRRQSISHPVPSSSPSVDHQATCMYYQSIYLSKGRHHGYQQVCLPIQLLPPVHCCFLRRSPSKLKAGNGCGVDTNITHTRDRAGLCGFERPVTSFHTERAFFLGSGGVLHYPSLQQYSIPVRRHR